MTDDLIKNIPASIIILAAGKGSRMQQATPKQFISLQGRPVLFHSIRPFLSVLPEADFIIVVPPGEITFCKQQLELWFPDTQFSITAGGDTRFHSVKNGLALVKKTGVVLVHDSARCLLTSDLVDRVFKTAAEKDTAIPTIACPDSVRLADGVSSHPLDRDKIRLVQTPQGFRSEILLQAFHADYRYSFTDEATVVEQSGFPVHLVEGEDTNIKITRPGDLERAESILSSRLR
jgi:2-C-methyl-D-erythritol 4-phosphate cytidylyltransferase